MIPRPAQGQPAGVEPRLQVNLLPFLLCSPQPCVCLLTAPALRPWQQLCEGQLRQKRSTAPQHKLAPAGSPLGERMAKSCLHLSLAPCTLPTTQAVCTMRWALPRAVSITVDGVRGRGTCVGHAGQQRASPSVLWGPSRGCIAPVQAEREAHAQTQQQLAEARAQSAERAAAEKRGMQEDIDGLQQQLEQVRATVLQCDWGPASVQH